jgi:hypothetical protein
MFRRPCKSPIADVDVSRYQGRNIVGGDPGKDDLMMMIDDANKTIRYSRKQRNMESKMRRNNTIMNRMRKKSGIMAIEQKIFDEKVRKTSSIDAYLDYITAYQEFTRRCIGFYQNVLFRKMKMRKYVYTEKSINKLIKTIKTAYGSDCVIGFGDWSLHHTKQMKGKPPTPNIGLRRKLRGHIPIIDVDEFRTSKVCNVCKNEVKNACINDKSIWRLVKCETCCSPNKQVFMNRDVNAAKNILAITHALINGDPRPNAYRRGNR